MEWMSKIFEAFENTEASRWLQNLPEHDCSECGKKSIFKTCIDCENKLDSEVEDIHE